MTDLNVYEKETGQGTDHKFCAQELNTRTEHVFITLDIVKFKVYQVHLIVWYLV